MKNSLPTLALAMKHFSPFRIHSSPLRSARSLRPALTSSGRQAVVGAGARLGDALAEEERVVREERLEEALLLLVGAGRGDQVAPLPALAEGLRDRAVAAGELRHHQRLRHEVDAVAAPFLRHRHGAEAEPRALLDDLPVERLRADRRSRRARARSGGSPPRRTCAPSSARRAARCSARSPSQVPRCHSAAMTAAPAARRKPASRSAMRSLASLLPVAGVQADPAHRARISAAACRASRPWRRSIRRRPWSAR